MPRGFSTFHPLDPAFRYKNRKPKGKARLKKPTDFCLRYVLNEASGDTAHDASHEHNDGIINAGVTWGSTQNGTGLSFSGALGANVDTGLDREFLPLTILIDYTADAPNSSKYLLDSSSNKGVAVRTTSANKIDIFIRDTAGFLIRNSGIAGSIIDGKRHTVGFTYDGVYFSPIFDGEFVAKNYYTPTGSGLPIGLGGSSIKLGSEYNGANGFVHKSGGLLIAERILTAAEVKKWHDDPSYALIPTDVWAPVAVSTSGITATGNLTSVEAVVSGVASVSVPLTSSGTLSADYAELVGTSDRLLSSSGSLSTSVVTVVGVATITGAVSSSGFLVSTLASLVGSAARKITTVGALTPPSALIVGATNKRNTTAGALASSTATLTGSSLLFAVHTSTGDLVSQTSVIAGSALRELITSGTLIASSAVISGSTSREIIASGSLSADATTITGYAAVGGVTVSFGTLTSDSANVGGSSTREVTAYGNLSASAAGIAGAGTLARSSYGALVSTYASIVGVATAGTGQGAVSTGNLLSDRGTLSGISYVLPGSGELPETINSLVNLNLANSPAIEDVNTYEAILAIHSACEIILREQDTIRIKLEARILALESN